MELRGTEEAAKDLEHIANYLFEHAPSRAADLVRNIYDAPTVLLTFPKRGRMGKKKGTRETHVVALALIVVYQFTSDVIHITRILHGAQKWP